MPEASLRSPPQWRAGIFSAAAAPCVVSPGLPGIRQKPVALPCQRHGSGVQTPILFLPLRRRRIVVRASVICTFVTRRSAYPWGNAWAQHGWRSCCGAVVGKGRDKLAFGLMTGCFALFVSEIISLLQSLSWLPRTSLRFFKILVDTGTAMLFKRASLAGSTASPPSQGIKLSKPRA